MNQTKPTWHSRTLWSAIIAAAAQVLVLFDIPIDQEAVLDAVLGVIELVGIVAAIYFRTTATKRLI